MQTLAKLQEGMGEQIADWQEDVKRREAALWQPRAVARALRDQDEREEGDL
jgi:hypothetical protein